MFYGDKGCKFDNTCASETLPAACFSVGEKFLWNFMTIVLLSQIFRQGVLNTLLLENFRLRPWFLLSLFKLHVTSKSSILAALLSFLWHFQECMIIFGMCINNTQNTKPWNIAVTPLHQISSFVTRCEYSFNLLIVCMKYCSISRLETGGHNRRR